MTLAAIRDATRGSGLIVMGALHLPSETDPGPDGETLVLLGAGPGFWPVLLESDEYRDGTPDPVDRWSERVVGGLARQFGARAVYPFGGPPYEPFISWALKSGRAFLSPTGLLVHDEVGLMISYRGALRFRETLELDRDTQRSPCETCETQPCLTACPVAALSPDAAYDVAACHDYLDTDAGQACMSAGCAVRRACPVSAGAARDPAQSALHMRSFHR